MVMRIALSQVNPSVDNSAHGNTPTLNASLISEIALLNSGDMKTVMQNGYVKRRH